MIEPHNEGEVRELVFAHPSEEEFARLLDFYQIEWEYEPHTFVLRRYEDGSVQEAFTPDFYLPAFDLYIEVTTLDRRLMRAKRQKIRRLRELYPDINIKLLDREGFEWLLHKYELEEKSPELIGKEALNG